MQYYAITKFDHTKSNPFVVIRINQGIIEKFTNGEWRSTSAYDGIINGSFNDYELLTDKEAQNIIKLK